jgi:hypothetical protein
VLPIRDKTLPTVIACLDVTLRRFGGVPTYGLSDNEKTLTLDHIARIAVHHPPVARAFNGLGLVAQAMGDNTAARGWHEQALAKRRELGEPWGVALAEVSLAGVFLDLGDPAAARDLLSGSISLSQELGDP